MKVMNANFRPFSTSGAFGMSGVMWNNAGNDIGNGPAGVSAGGAGAGNSSSFTRRQTNMWTYATPNLAGFQGSVAYSATNEATAQVNATTSKKPRLWGLGGTYTNGPLMLGAGYERHTNYNPAVVANYTSGDDRAWSADIAYTFMGTLKLSAIYTDTRYDTSPGTTLQAKSWGVYGDWAIAGPHRLRAGYSHLKDTSGNFGGPVVAGVCTAVTVGQWRANCGAGNTGADHYALQYAYSFSKRTELNFGYARINNDANSLIPLETLGGVNAGQHQNAWVFGTKHTF
jgi:predicted porin